MLGLKAAWLGSDSRVTSQRDSLVLEFKGPISDVYLMLLTQDSKGLSKYI